MNYERGDEYECGACGGTHEVREGKGLRVAGAGEGLDPGPYVRCPEAGFVPLGDRDGAPSPDDEGGDGWP